MIQKIGKIIICLISMVCILMALRVNTSVAYTYSRPNDNTWRDSIVVWNASSGSDPQTVKLSKDKKVVLVQGGYKSNAIYTDNIGVTQCSIVCQPNVYCVQHGTGLDLGSYKASKAFNVDTSQDAGKILAYIVNQNTSTSLSKDWVTPYQVALWKYLYDYKGKDSATDANRIVNGIKINNATSVDEDHDLSQDDLNKADKIIEAAKKYATNLNVTPTLSVSKENGNIKITTDAQKYEIYLNGKLYKEGENSQFTGDKSIPISTALNYTTTGQVTVQVKSIFTQYTASYRILYSYYDENDQLDAGQQRIIVVTGLNKTTKKNASTTVTEALDANVSMQKYITSVSDINGNNKTAVDSRDSYLSRENDINNNGSDSLGVVYKTKYDRDPSKSKSKKTPYKYDNPVKIDYGDKVTYTIEVSNNGAYPVENVVIRDAFPKIGDNIVVDINSIELNKNGNEMNTSSIPNSGMNYLISNSIAAGETKKFTITMKFNSEALKQRTDIIANTAWVEAVYSNVNGSVGLKGKNLKRDYRTADRDYVQMKQYAVSLEKYVVGVNGYRLEDFDNNGKVDGKQDAQLLLEYNSNIELTDSVKNKIYRYGDLNKDREINPADSLFLQRMITGKESIQNCREGSAIWYDTTSKYKENHPVQVETGDKVTFKIKLTNKGEGNIKVSKIKDTFTNDATKKLILKSITGNGEGTISGNIITFNNPLEIKAGESTFIEVTFEVTTENLNSEHRLNNTAEITEMKNRNNQSILSWDNDGTNNNKDTDYLKVLKQYAVGLNKFITKVNNADLITNTDNLLYNYNSTDRSGLSKTDKSTDANKVRVEPGDTVIYTLRLTNTSPTDRGHSAIKVSKIEDIPQKTNNNCYLDYDSSYEIKENGGGTVAKNGNKLTITFSKPEEIYPGKYLDITIRFKVVVKDAATATYQTLENTATVTEIKNRNNITVNDVDGTGNNSNSDYIKTKIYAVGIEKYVTGVGTKDNANSLVTNPNNINYNCATADRSGKERQAKRDDAVRVEPGDYVTFTIKVKNTGTKDGKADYVNYGKINTTTISEVFSDKDNEYKLVYDGITGATYDNKQITFVQDIVPGGSATFSIKFKVEVAKDKTNNYQLPYNSAKINVIKNENGTPVKDSKEETDNDNEDKDYLLTKIYKVALEKYVTKVNGYDLSTTAGKDYNVKELTDRKGKPTYDTDKSKAKSKANDIVNLETGDKVTFAITIKNIGDDYKNYGTVKTLNITDTSSDELKYNDSCSGARYSDGNITGVSAINVGDETTISLEYMVELNENQIKQKIDLYNHAEIVDTSIINKNDISVKDSDGDKNNKDEDYLRTKVYAVSLEKFVSKVEMNGTDITDAINMGPQKEGMDRPREGYAEHNYNNLETTEENCDKTKRKNPVTTVTGDSVTYTILLKNDSKAKTGIDTTKDSNNDKNSYNTAVKIGKVIDYLPNGMKYGKNEYTNDNYEVTYDFETSNGQNLSNGRLLYPDETAIVTITATVIEDKMSLNILKNVAEINEDSLTNKNGSKVYDTTENNNKDADYIQLNYKHDPNPNNPDANPDPGNNAFFAGTVWNDMALNKTGNNYNGTYDDDTKINNGEPKLKDIKVYLYRSGTGAGCAQIVADTATDRDGKYSFGDNDLQNEKNDKYFEKNFEKDDMSARYIKGPKKSKDDNRWDGYYSYYIVFAYDGITYTATPDGNTCADIFENITDKTYPIDSNAREDNDMYTINKKSSRKDFNTNISKMVKNRSISYDTKNDADFIPESRYQYDESTMTIQSSTKEINLSEFQTKFDEKSTDKCLECSKYIGLGLRGRDIFDLELTSEVSRVEVTVNNIVGNYEYTNKVNVRKEDVNSNYLSDMANSYTSSLKEGAQYVQTAKNGDENDSQIVRKTDLDKSLTNTNRTEYSDGNLLNSIYVIYKISVNNASPTPGYATQIVDYYDKKYQLEGVYTDEKCNSDSKCTNYSDESTSDYNYVIVKDLKEIYDIYVKLQLTDAKKVLTENAWDKGMATYNMAEIYQYETGINKEKGQTEYTRGLIDKDSAPGSARIEKARLTGKTFSEDTTLDYYFKGENLDKLKYEDDTYATPTLYFTTPGSIRVLSGTVFEDYTVVTDDRVRTGDGIQNSIEPGIEGAKVQLIEKTSSGEIIRYETFTNSSGKFTFKNYLPGNYIMKYFYGDNEKTFYIGSTNTKSYNGEDFKSTNNSTLVEGATVNILPIKDTGMQWYSWNEKGVSTATDNAEKRQEVSDNACGLSDDEMIKLNDVRDGIIKQSNKDETSEEVRNKLLMYANTPDFTLTVEQSVKGKQNDKFTAYEVEQMNFGIAEVPVTTIDLQKHVSLFSIKDSTGQIEIASAKIADNYTIGIKLNNITDENKRRKVQAVLGSLYTVPSLEECKKTTEEKNISKELNKTKMQSIRKALIQYSIPNIVTIIPNWTTKGNVLPGVKATTTVLDVSIEDAKLQGAKLQVTYDVSADIYAEKDFTLDSKALEPSIKYVVDFVDNNLSYAESLTGNDKWQVAQSDALYYGDGDDSYSLRKLDKSNKYTTTVSTKSDNDLLKTKVGTTGTTQITLERILTAQDTTIQDIITSSIDAFEYKNEIRILQLGYNNTIDETKIKNKDRIRTPERYIIVPGKHHDSATSETIAIHPPTGDTSTHTMYYIIGAAGLAVLAIGAFDIKKFVLKCKGIKK